MTTGSVPVPPGHHENGPRFQIDGREIGSLRIRESSRCLWIEVGGRRDPRPKLVAAGVGQRGRLCDLKTLATD